MAKIKRNGGKVPAGKNNEVGEKNLDLAHSVICWRKWRGGAIYKDR